jgi:hypothetical protein
MLAFFFWLQAHRASQDKFGRSSMQQQAKGKNASDKAGGNADEMPPTEDIPVRLPCCSSLQTL